MLDTVFCLRTITGTERAEGRAVTLFTFLWTQPCRLLQNFTGITWTTCSPRHKPHKIAPQHSSLLESLEDMHVDGFADCPLVLKQHETPGVFMYTCLAAA